MNGHTSLAISHYAHQRLRILALEKLQKRSSRDRSRIPIPAYPLPKTRERPNPNSRAQFAEIESGYPEQRATHSKNNTGRLLNDVSFLSALEIPGGIQYTLKSLFKIPGYGFYIPVNCQFLANGEFPPLRTLSIYNESNG